MSEKLCVFCEHMEFDGGGKGNYAESETMFCMKGRWSGKGSYGGDAVYMDYTLDDFRAVILLAKDCKDYKPPK